MGLGLGAGCVVNIAKQCAGAPMYFSEPHLREEGFKIYIHVLTEMSFYIG